MENPFEELNVKLHRIECVLSEICDILKIKGVNFSVEAKNVTDLNLSVRALNFLAYSNIKTVHELIGYSASELIKYNGMGKKSLSEIQLVLEEMGLSLKK